MSTNCIQCVVNKRTGIDLLCDKCRDAIPGDNRVRQSGEKCQTCGFGFILPSLYCDHCNTLHGSSDATGAQPFGEKEAVSESDAIRQKCRQEVRSSLRCALNNLLASNLALEVLKWIDIAKEECELWTRYEQTGITPEAFAFQCPRCDGEGRNGIDGECLACDGTGFKPSNPTDAQKRLMQIEV